MSAISRALSGWIIALAGGILLIYAFVFGSSAFYALFDVGVFLLVIGPLVFYSRSQPQANRPTDRLKFAKFYSFSDSDRSGN
jgi:hypothetical protein